MKKLSSAVLLTVAVVVAVVLFGWHFQRVTGSTYSEVFAVSNMASIKAAEFQYYRLHQRFCDFNELYAADKTVSRTFSAKGMDDRGVRYSVEVASNGQSFKVTAKTKYDTFTEEGKASDASAAPDTAGSSDG